MRCLVTGFAPMYGRDANLSWAVAQAAGSALRCGREIATVQLPVSFSWAPELLRQSVRRYSPDVVLMLGEYGPGSCIKLERIAVNLMDAIHPDCDGSLPDAEPIDPSLPAACFSTLPLKTLRDAVAAEQIAVEISNSCGLYVCNRTYFEALQLCAGECSGMKALFVHVPREGMSLNDCTKAAQTILLFLSRYEPNK